VWLVELGLGKDVEEFWLEHRALQDTWLPLELSERYILKDTRLP
jgi:hypothetical protein